MGNDVLLVGNTGHSGDPGKGDGACIARTSRFQQALLNADFSIDVCTPGSERSGISHIRQRISENNFRCIVSISPHPAESAVLSGTSLPHWIDMNGMHPAEINLTSDKPGLPRLEMLRILALENLLLRRGDRFSAPSSRQTHAILGELFLLGRLDYRSRYNVPVHPIPHCAMPATLSETDRTPGSPFNIISTGAFNSWFDPETLFKGIEYAMMKSSEIFFTATGGLLPYAAEKYESFLKLVSASRFRDRFSLMGWVTEEELQKIQHSASAAVYTDVSGGETILGARTRAVDWINRGIPVVCTSGAEISEDIHRYGMGIVIPQNDWQALGEAFLLLASDNDFCAGIRKAQAAWRERAGDINTVFKPLIEWCAEPTALETVPLGKPTVSTVSSFSYRTAVFREIARKTNFFLASSFVLKSMLIRGRSGKSLKADQ